MHEVGIEIESGRKRERGAGSLLQLVSRAEFFKELDDHGLELVLSSARERRLDRRQLCFREDEPATLVYLLTRGRLKLTQLTPDGRQVILRLLEPGEMFGGVALFSKATYPVTAEAVEPCELLAWDGRSMQRLMEARPKIAMNVIEHLAELVQALQERVRELATERVEQRIARALLRLCGRPPAHGERNGAEERRVGARTADGKRTAARNPGAGRAATVHLSRQELGELTGATLYTVSRILSRWESEGIVSSRRERITVLNPDELERIAGELL